MLSQSSHLASLGWSGLLYTRELGHHNLNTIKIACGTCDNSKSTVTRTYVSLFERIMLNDAKRNKPYLYQSVVRVPLRFIELLVSFITFLKQI